MNWLCTLLMTHVAKDAEVRLSRQITIPFVPTIGTRLLMGASDEPFCFQIDSVTWETYSSQFVLEEDCVTELHCPCLPSDKCCVWTEEAAKYFRSNGWSINFVRRGKKRLHEVRGAWTK